MAVDRRKYLADALFELVVHLQKTYGRQGHGEAAFRILLHSIVTHAGETTLENIVEDLKSELRLAESEIAQA